MRDDLTDCSSLLAKILATCSSILVPSCSFKNVALVGLSIIIPLHGEYIEHGSVRFDITTDCSSLCSNKCVIVGVCRVRDGSQGRGAEAMQFMAAKTNC